MKSIQDALTAFNQSLKSGYDQTEINSISYLVLEHITGLSRAQLRGFPENALTGEQQVQIADVLVQLKTGKPIQYVLGQTEFYGLNFKVNSSVLIPRPETEELVEWIIESVRERNKPEQILDIGSGSGCIPVTLKKHLPEADISAIDISAEALKVARENAALNRVEVNFIEADILQPQNTVRLTSSFSVIVSNPPYVKEHEKTDMHNNVLNYEPHLALFVPDEDPLLFYRAIADFAIQHLESSGLLFFEINESLGEQTINLLTDKGFKNSILKQDMRSKDRMIRTEKQ